MFDLPGYTYVETLQEKSEWCRNIVVLCQTNKKSDTDSSFDAPMVVIKLMELTKTGSYSIHNEIDILKTIPKHKRVVTYITSFSTEKYLAIVLEYVPNSQDLFDFIIDNPRMKPEAALNIFAQLIQVISHLHLHGINHGDVKPENILIETKTHQIKLLDFEFASYEKYSSRFTGSSDYASPEKLMLMKNFDTHASDIWSVGVTFYAILTQSMAFNGDKSAIRKGKYRKPSKDPLMNDLFSCMLQVDPTKRSSADQMKKHLIWEKFDISFETRDI